MEQTKALQADTIRKFGWKDKVGYLFGDFGNDFTFQLASGFLLIFYTKVLGIGAGMVGTMFLIARIVDAFTDVGMGTICDKSKLTAEGRFRPWIRRMSIPVVLASVLMYNYFVADWPYAAKVAYMFITYLIWGSVCYTGINIPYGSMASVITQDSTERASLSTFRSLGALLCGLIIGVATPMIIYVQNGSETITSGPRFMMLAGVYGVLALIGYQICYRFCVERIEIPTQSSKVKTNIIKDLGALWKDRAFLSVIGTALLVLTATISSQALNQFLFLDYFGNTKILPLVSLIMMGAILSVTPFTSKITKRFGKKEAGGVALLVAGSVNLLIYLLGIRNPMVYVAVSVIGFFGMGYFTMISWAFITDVIDNYQIKTGTRKDGTVYAVYSFSRKLGQAIAGGIGGWALAAIGYNSATPVQVPEVQSGIFALSMLIPAVCFIGGGLLTLFFNPLSKAKIEENQKIIEKMMNA